MILRWALAVTSMLISLTLAEFFVRALYPAPFLGLSYVPPQKTFFEYDERPGWRGRPGAEGHYSATGAAQLASHLLKSIASLGGVQP